MFSVRKTWLNFIHVQAEMTLMAVQFVNVKSFVFLRNLIGPKKPTSECVAANQAETLITPAIKRPRKHTNSLLILHGTHVRKRALASQPVASHRPMRCAWEIRHA